MSAAVGLILAAALAAHSVFFQAMFTIPKLIVLSLGFLAIGGYIAWTGKVRGGLLGASLLMLAVVLASAAVAREPYLAIVGRHNGYALGLIGLLIVFGISLVGASEKILAIAGAALGLHALYEWAGLTEQWVPGRAISTIGGPTDLGLILAMLLPVALSKSFVYGLPVFLGVLASGSRGALVASAAGVIAWRLRCE